MSVILYNVFLFFFKTGIFISSLFNEKAGKWLKGRRNALERINEKIDHESKIIWMHCASLGEFEQGRPLLEKIKTIYPVYKILLTFFSPSGFEAQKNYKGADWIFYLPLDGPSTARKFLETVNPVLVIFVKYEFWYYYLKKIKYRNIPLILVSALFRDDMSFFKWYGGLQRKMLSRFDHLFVQNQESMDLMNKIGLGKISSISGDTRFDRVIEIAQQFEPVKLISEFIQDAPAIVAGSTWPDDEQALSNAFNHLSTKIKLIIAPHEVDEKHIQELKKLFPEAVLYSQLNSEKLILSNILIIDSIGLLSKIYRYATICYVGGGLRNMGVHNVLEAAVYFKPVLFGPHYHKYKEAVGLVQSGGALSFDDPKKNGAMLTGLISGLLISKNEYDYCSKAAGSFVESNRGATQKIMDYVQVKRLLTS